MEIAFIVGLVGTVIFLGVGTFVAPILSLPPGLTALFVALYTLTMLSAMVLAIRWYVRIVRLMRGRGEVAG